MDRHHISVSLELLIDNNICLILILFSSTVNNTVRCHIVVESFYNL